MGNSDLLEVAIRELEEESGIVGAELYSEELFDIDIHQIPFSVKKNEPQHYHFDV
jgi:8-oxo-dGTP pyrophosphatase MutT (NUDIX family)